MPKVSIIIAAYDVEKYISECVSSLLNQSYNDFEIIICDDKSTDNTVAVLKDISRQDNRIKLLFNENNVRSGETRNRCIKAAEGEYIAIQDADDLSHIDRIALQAQFLDNNLQYSIVGCNAELFSDKKTWGIRKMKDIPSSEDFLWGIPFLHPSVMMRKEDVLRVGGYRMSKETRRAEDYDLFVRMYAAGKKGYNLQDPLYYYREDKQAYKKRKYRYRIDEAIIRYKSFKTLGLLPKGIPYIIKPLLVGLIPSALIIKYREIKEGIKTS